MAMATPVQFPSDAAAFRLFPSVCLLVFDDLESHADRLVYKPVQLGERNSWCAPATTTFLFHKSPSLAGGASALTDKVILSNAQT